jgi:hypothetical protein
MAATLIRRREAAVTHPAAWHQALAYAVSGRRFEELGYQAAPDLEEMVAFLEPKFGVDLDRAVLERPHRPPADLVAGLGAAQLWAAVADLRRRLARAEAAVTVTQERPLTTDERRLMQDVPPHHGT